MWWTWNQIKDPIHFGSWAWDQKKKQMNVCILMFNELCQNVTSLNCKVSRKHEIKKKLCTKKIYRCKPLWKENLEKELIKPINHYNA